MERNYATQMEAARKGIVTPELEIVAKKEQMTVEELMFIDEIVCMDLFPGEDPREKIAIFELDYME